MDNITYRSVEPDDAIILYTWFNDAYICRENNFRAPYLSSHSIRCAIETGAYSNDTDCYLIFERDHQLLGVGLITSLDRVRRNCEITIVASDDLPRREATWLSIGRGLISMCFSELAMHRVYLYAYEHSPEMENLYSELGAVLETVERECIFRLGRYWDRKLYSMLFQEWSGT